MAPSLLKSSSSITSFFSCTQPTHASGKENISEECLPSTPARPKPLTPARKTHHFCNHIHNPRLTTSKIPALDIHYFGILPSTFAPSPRRRAARSILLSIRQRASLPTIVSRARSLRSSCHRPACRTRAGSRRLSTGRSRGRVCRCSGMGLGVRALANKAY